MPEDEDAILGAPLEMPDGDEPHHKPPSTRASRPRRALVKKLGLIVLILAALAGLALGAWHLTHGKKSTPSQSVGQTTGSQTAPKTSDVPAAGTTKVFSSDNLALQLTYPTTWTTTETSDSGLRVESPTFNYQTVNKGVVNGNFRIYIRQQARASDSTYIGRGVAAQPSIALTYTKPAPTQRQTTYLTNFGLDTPDNFAYFMIAGNFNLKKGDSLGPNYGKEQGTFIIAGGYSGKDLKDDMATNQVPLAGFDSTNAYKQAVDIIKSLQLN